MSPRPRSRIIENLEEIYRAAYEQAKAVDDERRMAELDAAFQREQLLLEVLLDIRDGIYTIGEADSASSALEKLNVLRQITRLR